MKKRSRQMIAIVMVVALVVAFASIATYAASCPYCTSGNTVTTTTDTFIGRRMRVALIMGQVIYTKLSIRPRTSSADLVEKHLKELPITFTTSALTHNNPD